VFPPGRRPYGPEAKPLPPIIGGIFSTAYLRPANISGAPHSPDKSGAAVSL